MPVRSLNSRVFAWPRPADVESEARLWAGRAGSANGNVLRIGIFGSLAERRWGVGSDLDLVVIVRATELPFEKRGLDFDTLGLPVHADVLVYTEREWAGDRAKEGHSAPLPGRVIWLFERTGAPDTR